MQSIVGQTPIDENDDWQTRYLAMMGPSTTSSIRQNTRDGSYSAFGQSRGGVSLSRPGTESMQSPLQVMGPFAQRSNESAAGSSRESRGVLKDILAVEGKRNTVETYVEPVEIRKPKPQLQRVPYRQKPVEEQPKPVWRAGGGSTNLQIFNISSKDEGSYGKHVEWSGEPDPAEENKVVFNRYDVLVSHREKARQVALKARTLINAKAKKMNALHLDENRKEKEIADDVKMFEKIEHRVADNRVPTPINYNEMRHMLNLADSSGLDHHKRHDSADSEAEFEMPEREVKERTPLSEILMYTPQQTRQRHPAARHARSHTTEDRKDASKPGTPTMREHKDNKVKTSSVDTSMGSLEIEAKRKVIREKEAREKKDFEILLGRETSMQADALNTLGHMGDIVPAAFKVAMCVDDQVSIAWHAFVHLRCINDAPISEVDAEAVYDLMTIAPPLTLEEQIEALHRIAMLMDRNRFVYLKAFTGHLRRLARAGPKNITSTLSDAFSTLIFRCKCPETGDVYISPQLRQAIQIRETTPDPDAVRDAATRASVVSERSVRGANAGMTNSSMERPVATRASEAGALQSDGNKKTENDKVEKSDSRTTMDSEAGNLLESAGGASIGSPTTSQRQATGVRVRSDSLENQSRKSAAVRTIVAGESDVSKNTPSLSRRASGQSGADFSPDANAVRTSLSASAGSAKLDVQATQRPALLVPPQINTNRVHGPMYVTIDPAEEFGWYQTSQDLLYRHIFEEQIVLSPFGLSLELMMRFWNQIFSPQEETQ
eukprot:jgi/Hompol1/1463/HPOL_002710-RA